MKYNYVVLDDSGRRIGHSRVEALADETMLDALQRHAHDGPYNTTLRTEIARAGRAQVIVGRDAADASGAVLLCRSVALVTVRKIERPSYLAEYGA